MKQTHNTNPYRLAVTAIFAALVVVFQLISYFVKIGPFGLTVTLVPVVLGGALLGVGGGAILGGVFGIVVSLCSIFGLDGGGYILFGTSPIMTVLVCMVKGIAAGLAAAAVYRALSKKNSTAACLLASATAPIVNTGIFTAAMFLFFRDTLNAWAGETDVLTYAITGMVGINFVVEFCIGLLLSPMILAVIRAVGFDKKSKEW